jgi:putative DNA primase/helicase
MAQIRQLAEDARLKHDFTVQVATASGRNAATWRNAQMDLSEFVRKLGRTVRTVETVDQYHAMPKAEQDRIKDVGAYVGGLLKGGRRYKDSVATRSMMTFDADHAGWDFVERAHAVLGHCCYTIYSTHKHKPDSPRLRLVVYPDSPMLPDQYQPVMRKIAEKIGIESMDSSTYDVNRLMYWPSTPADGEFVFVHNDKPGLSVHTILDEYNDWQDVTQWPQSQRENKRLTSQIKQQANPLTKKGIVGAFCRSVDIRQALAMTGAYTQDSANRYTYTEGTTTKGVVVYQDCFAYSNHESDPAFGQSCNAFDLLRIHKFGHLDADAKPETPPHRLPSFAAMDEYAREQPGVKQDLISAGLEITADEFDDQGDDDTKWLGLLQVFDSGEIKTTFTNAVLILQHDRHHRNAMRYNLLSERVEHVDGTLWGEKHSLPLRHYIGRKYLADFPESKIEHAIAHRARMQSYHPVRDWIKSLEWDGVERADRLFVRWLHCKDNAYTRQAAKCLMVAAVARAFEPGYKFDYVPVLGGRQGIGKSTFVAILGGQWYGELSSFDHKIAAEEMQGRWIMEITELGATNRSELEQQKAFISATSTTVRMAYARHPIEMMRQCVFIATTNQAEYLKDSTGNRRWWPIESGIPEGREIDLEGLRAEVDQLWAEAYARYLLGESTLLDGEARAIAQSLQDDKRESDQWEGVIAEWLAKKADRNRYQTDNMAEELRPRDRVCVAEIWQDCIGDRTTCRRQDSNRIAAIMDRMPGWQRSKPMRFGDRYGVQRGWVKTDQDDADLPF